MLDFNYMSMFVYGEVSAKLRALPGLGPKLQLDKFFYWFWAFVDGVILRVYVECISEISLSYLVDGQGP